MASAFAPVTDFPLTSRTEADTGHEQDQSLDINQRLAEIAELIRPGRGSTQAGQLPVPYAVSAVQSQIDALPSSDDIEVRPTPYAHFQLRTLVVSAYSSIFSGKSERRSWSLPRLVLGTDESGGVMVSWSAGRKYVTAKFGALPESRSFLYFEQAAIHELLELSEKTLVDKLKWLCER